MSSLNGASLPMVTLYADLVWRAASSVRRLRASGMRFVVRHQHPLRKKMRGQLETRERIARIRFARLPPEQERRQREQAIAILFARGPRDGAARSRRDIDEVIGRSGGGAAREIETEAELIEQPDLPAHEQRRPILEA